MMLLVWFPWYGILTAIMTQSYSSDIFRENRQVLFEGEEQLNSVQKLTLSPYGSCWTSAVSNLKITCPQLTEESHKNIAFVFANCFMQQLGYKNEACHEEQIPECLEKIKSDPQWFQAYLQYYTHTHNMCYFLNHHLWLQRTEQTIKKLTISSDEIGKRLEETSNKQMELLNLQSESVDTQKTLLQQGQSLNRYLESTQNSVISIIDDFKKTTEGQQHLVMDMLDKLSSWIQFLVDHVTGIYTAAFYLTVPCILFIVTSTPRTNRARAWLIFLWLTIFVSEIKIKLDHQSLWYMRYFGMSCSLVLLILFGVMYKDYESLNNRLLNELYHLVVTQSQNVTPWQQNNQQVVPKDFNMVPAGTISLDQVRNILNACSIREIQEHGSEEVSSSDETYMGESDSDSGDSTASFYSTISSSSTSSRAVSPLSNYNTNNTSFTAILSNGLTARNSYVSDILSPAQGPRYNLRPRMSLGSPALNNSFVDKESPQAFQQLIKVQERNSKIHSILQTRHLIGK